MTSSPENGAFEIIDEKILPRKKVFLLSISKNSRL